MTVCLPVSHAVDFLSAQHSGTDLELNILSRPDLSTFVGLDPKPLDPLDIPFILVSQIPSPTVSKPACPDSGSTYCE